MSEEEREPTLEELMAELDAGPELPSPTKPTPTKPAPAPSKATDAKEVKSPAKARQAPVVVDPPAAKAAAPAELAEKKAAGPEETAKGGGEKDDLEKMEDSFYQAQNMAMSFWKTAKETLKETAASAKESANQAMQSDSVGEMRGVLNSASRELRATAHDVVASAKTLNSRLLVKPLATFGVPLTVVMQRECEEEEAEAVPQAVERLIDTMEQHAKAGGALPYTLFARSPTAGQRARLYELRDAIDRGEDMETFELSGDMLTTAALLKLFLLELPTPLLTFGRYHDFLSALLDDGGFTAAVDVAERMPPCNRAVARRILGFLQESVVSRAEDSAVAAARLAVVIGPLMLRPKEEEVTRVLIDLPAVRDSTVLLMRHSAYIFQHNCWFLRPFLGAYTLREGKASPGGGESGETILEVDADGIIWEGKRCKPGSEVDASGWGRLPARTGDGGGERMVLAAKFEERTLLLAFSGEAAEQGIDMGEEVVISEESGGAGAAEKVTRRFTGSFLRPLPWQAAIASWAKSNVALRWDEEAHPADLQELWRLSFPDQEPPARKDARWNAIGFQGADPSTDFRGAGMVALSLMLALARDHTQAHCAMMANSSASPAGTPPDAKDAPVGGYGYPYTCGLINVTHMLMDLALLLPAAAAGSQNSSARFPNKRAASCRRALGGLLLQDATAFQALFVAATKVLDEEWSKGSRKYMSFNAVFDKVRPRVRAALRHPELSGPGDLERLMLLVPRT